MSRTFIAAALAVTLPLFATEPNPSKDQRAAVQRLLEAMKVDDSTRSAMDALIGQFEKQMLDSVNANGNQSEDLAEAKELYAEFRQRAAKIDLSGDVHDAMVRIYARYFTNAEIEAMTAFYTSPAGRKSIEVMPQLMQESMQAGVDHLAPQVERAFREALEEGEKKRPWRRTMSDLRSVATAIEAYAVDNEKYPSGDYKGLEEILVPTYLSKLPEKDMWNHAYAYTVSEDGLQYRLVSAGADTIFEWDSRRIAVAKEGEVVPTRYRDRLEDDLIYADGEFVQLPVQARPRE